MQLQEETLITPTWDSRGAFPRAGGKQKTMAAAAACFC